MAHLANCLIHAHPWGIIERSFLARRGHAAHAPPAATHWSTRSLAKAQGLSEATIRRIWKQHDLKPHLIRTFKISHDKQFVEKLYDVVGLYLNPPAKSLMLSVAWRAMC